MLVAVAVTLVAAGAWSLQSRAKAEPGPLAPLAWLVGGNWQPQAGDGPSRSFEWSSAGLILHETRESPDGAPAGEVVYHWHHQKDEVGLYGVLPTSHFEGVLRSSPNGVLELQWRLHDEGAEPTLYRERLQRDGQDRLLWTRRRVNQDEEVLDGEAILIRKGR